MRDPHNQYRPYSIPATERDREYSRRLAEEASSREARHQMFLKSLECNNAWTPSRRVSIPDWNDSGRPPFSRVLLVLAIYLVPVLLML